MAAWATVGTGPFAWYADVGRAGPWGDYGHWKGIEFVPDPRTGVITEANANLQPWWNSDDRRAASTFDNGRYDAGTAGADVMRGTGLGDRLYGLGGADRLTGGGQADTLWGGFGADRIAGGDGDDRLKGGSGQDSLMGGGGNDVLKGGRGADLLTGGRGADVFVFRKMGHGGDEISDFVSGRDQIRLLGRAFGGQAGEALGPGALQLGAEDGARKAGVRVIFDDKTGQIWADADGHGGADAVLLVTLSDGATITAADFLFS